MQRVADNALFNRRGWSRPGPLGYGVAVLGAAAATIAISLFDIARIAPFFIVVIVATWVGGTKPGLVAMALAFAVLTVTGMALQSYRLLFFVLISSFLVWVIASERTTTASLRRAIRQLQLQNDELAREKSEALALQERLRRNEAEQRLVIDTIPAMAWTLRPDGQLEFLNRRWLDYSGMTKEEAIDGAITTMHPDDAPQVIERWGRYLAAGRGYEEEMRLRAANGEYRRFLVRTVPHRDDTGAIVRWYGISTDIEDRERAEHALRESAERLQQLSRRLLAVQEEERRNLSRELHDEFGQLLATAKLHLHAAKSDAGEPARSSLEQCAAVLEQAGDHVRTLALALRPALLETAGLDSTLRWLARQHEERTQVPTHVSGEVGSVPSELAVACFRVAQEALTNVVQHSGAHNVWIDLREREGRLELAVRDDGAGFDVASMLETAPRGGHLGLLGMKERVQILDGTLEIESGVGRGTRIVASFPRAPRAPSAS